MKRHCVGLLLVACAGVGDASAQRAGGLRAGFSAPPVGGEVAVVKHRSFLGSDKYPATYWKVGALVTAIPAILAFNLLYGEEDDATIFGRIVGTALVGVVFAVPGAAIGGLFPKGKPAEQPAEP